MTKTYLGDGVYIETGRYNGEFILTTENGVEVTNTIYIDNQMINDLIHFVKIENGKDYNKVAED